MPGRAKTALQRVMALERRLQNAEAVGRRRQAFHGPDLAAVDLRGKRQAGPRRLAVDDDGAGAAHPMFAADIGAGRADLMAQEIGQQQPRLRLAPRTGCRSVRNEHGCRWPACNRLIAAPPAPDRARSCAHQVATVPRRRVDVVTRVEFVG